MIVPALEHLVRALEQVKHERQSLENE